MIIQLGGGVVVKESFLGTGVWKEFNFLNISVKLPSQHVLVRQLSLLGPPRDMSEPEI